jgi:hypothetical protein
MKQTRELCQRLLAAVPETAGTVREEQDAIQISAPASRAGHQLEVRVRDVSDVEVAYFVPGKRGSPFEALFTAPPNEADALADEVVEFVCDLLAERRVLVWDSRLLRGGRRFPRASELTPAVRRHASWMVSWLGTYDWSRSKGAKRSSKP